MTSTKPQFGKQFRHNHFLFPKDVTPLNHGSYGAIPKEVKAKYQELLDEDLSFPCIFQFKLPTAVEHSLKTVAGLVGASYKNLALVPNATSGVNIFIRSFPFAEGDTILVTSVIYDSCGNTIEYVVKRYKLNLIVLDLKFPLSNDKILQKFQDQFKSNKDIKLCFYDTVVSMPGVKMPYLEITKLCKKYNVISCIDGAHSIGMLPIDLSTIDCDFYVSNLHKWFYLPRGCAVMYVHPKFQEFIQPFPISHSYKNVKFYQKFLVNGSNNYCSYLSIDAAVHFVNETCGGLDNIRDYCNSLRQQSIEYFRNNGYDILENEEESLSTFMFNVIPKLDEDKEQYFKKNLVKPEFFGVMKEFMVNASLEKENKSYFQYGWHDGKMYVRFSCQIYNELDELKNGLKEFSAVLDEFYDSDLYKQYL